MMTDKEAGERDRVVEIALSWERTPYHHRARIKGVGVDCAHYLIAVYSEAGLIEPFDPGHYPPDWHMHNSGEQYLSFVEKFCQPVNYPMPGDIVVFKFGRAYSHGAIILNWPEIIAANIGSGVVRGNGEAGFYFNRVKDQPREPRFYSFWG